MCINLVDPERHRVGFEGFFIIVLSLLYEGPNVPAYMRMEVFAHAILYESYAWFALAKVNQYEALHAHGFYGNPDRKHNKTMKNGLTSMLRMFFEDLVSDFTPFRELLLFVCLQELREELAFLLCQWLRGHGRAELGYVPVVDLAIDYSQLAALACHLPRGGPR